MTTWTISKRFAFSASHRLHGLAEGHPCGRLHGHNYEVEVAVESSTIDQHGFVLDYGLLAPFKDWLDTLVDHRHLNDLMPMQPSAENMAAWLREVVLDTVPIPEGATVAVGVSETPKTWAWAR